MQLNGASVLLNESVHHAGEGMPRYLKDRLEAFGAEMREVFLRLPDDHVLLQMAKEKESARHISGLVSERVYDALRSNQEKTIQDLLHKSSGIAEQHRQAVAEGEALAQRLNAAQQQTRDLAEKCERLQQTERHHVQQREVQAERIRKQDEAFKHLQQQMHSFRKMVYAALSSQPRLDQQAPQAGLHSLMHSLQPFMANLEGAPHDSKLLEDALPLRDATFVQSFASEAAKAERAERDRLRQGEAVTGSLVAQVEVLLKLFVDHLRGLKVGSSSSTHVKTSRSLDAVFTLCTGMVQHVCTHLQSLQVVFQQGPRDARLTPDPMPHMASLQQEAERGMHFLLPRLQEVHADLKRALAQAREKVGNLSTEKSLAEQTLSSFQQEHQKARDQAETKEAHARLADMLTKRLDETTSVLLRARDTQDMQTMNLSRISQQRTLAVGEVAAGPTAPAAEHYISKAEHIQKLHDLENSVMAETKNYVEQKEHAVLKEAERRVERAEAALASLQQKEERLRAEREQLQLKAVELKNENVMLTRALEADQQRRQVAESAVAVLKGEVVRASSRSLQSESPHHPHPADAGAALRGHPEEAGVPMSYHMATLRLEADLRRKQRALDLRVMAAYRGLVASVLSELSGLMSCIAAEGLADTLVDVQRATGGGAASPSGTDSSGLDLHDVWLSVRGLKAACDNAPVQQQRVGLLGGVVDTNESFDMACRMGADPSLDVTDEGDDESYLEAELLMQSGGPPRITPSMLQQRRHRQAAAQEGQMRMHQKYVASVVKELARSHELGGEFHRTVKQVVGRLGAAVIERDGRHRQVHRTAARLLPAVASAQRIHGEVRKSFLTLHQQVLADVSRLSSGLVERAAQCDAAQHTTLQRLAREQAVVSRAYSEARDNVRDLLHDVSQTLQRPFPKQLYDGLFPAEAASPSNSPTRAREAFRHHLHDYVEDVRPLAVDASSYATLQPEFAKLRTTHEVSEARLNELEETVQLREHAVQQLQGQLAEAESERDAMLNQVEGHMREHDELHMVQEKAVHEKHRLESENHKLKKRQTVLQVHSASEHEKLQDAMEDVQRQLREDITALQEKNHCLDGELSRLSEHHDSMLQTFEKERGDHHSRMDAMQLSHKATVERLHAESRLNEQLLGDLSDKDKELARVSIQLSQLS